LPFRRTIKEDSKRELMIFLTPFIVNDSGSSMKVASDEMAKSEFSKKGMQEPAFEKYLSDLPLPTDGAEGDYRGPKATPIPAAKTKTMTTTTRTSVKKPQGN
jgi:hypothetical protein